MVAVFQLARFFVLRAVVSLAFVFLRASAPAASGSSYRAHQLQAGGGLAARAYPSRGRRNSKRHQHYSVLTSASRYRSARPQRSSATMRFRRRWCCRFFRTRRSRPTRCSCHLTSPAADEPVGPVEQGKEGPPAQLIADMEQWQRIPSALYGAGGELLQHQGGPPIHTPHTRYPNQSPPI